MTCWSLHHTTAIDQKPVHMHLLGDLDKAKKGEERVGSPGDVRGPHWGERKGREGGEIKGEEREKRQDLS